ncbi:hypothetical protein ACOMHN_048295 [Nucella lapillus]
MACGWLLAVILTVAITPSGANPEATITFNPPNLTLTAQQIDKGEGRVNVTCVATSNDTTQLSELRINRFDAALKPKVMLAQASSDLHNGIAHLHDGTDLHNRAQVFGSVAEGSITVTVDRVTCGDVTKYTCLVKYAARKTRQQSRRLAVNEGKCNNTWKEVLTLPTEGKCNNTWKKVLTLQTEGKCNNTWKEVLTLLTEGKCNNTWKEVLTLPTEGKCNNTWKEVLSPQKAKGKCNNTWKEVLTLPTEGKCNNTWKEVLTLQTEGKCNNTWKEVLSRQKAKGKCNNTWKEVLTLPTEGKCNNTWKEVLTLPTEGKCNNTWKEVLTLQTEGKCNNTWKEVLSGQKAMTPGPLTLTASPEVATLRHVDDVITMTCEGPLGTVSKHQQPRWVWEYRHTYDVNAPWALYHASPGEVTSGPMVQRACYARGSTTLKRRLTMADSERQYRCYVATDWVSYNQYAASWSVGTLRSAGDHSINQGLMVGLGVGGCVGVVVGLLVVLAAGLVLLVWRRRQLAARKTQTVNCPLLPPHRHAAWYGEYLEPVVCVPQQQQQQQQQQYQQEDDQTGIYSEIPEQLCPDKKPPPFSPPPPPSAVKGQIA